MSNYIVVSDQEDAVRKWLADYMKDAAISEHEITEYFPNKNGYTIEQLREIQQVSGHHYNTTRLFVLWNFDSAKELIQNTFLKTLEEHAPEIEFILTTPSESALLPTILSRSTLIYLTKKHTLTPEESKSIAEFIEQVSTQNVLASTLLSYTPSKKREEIAAFIARFITYGYGNLNRDQKKRTWLADKLHKAVLAFPLISKNFVDSEAVLDNIFLT